MAYWRHCYSSGHGDLRVAYPPYCPYKRARIHAFYKHGVEKLHIPLVIEVLPALLHVSLFLFFAGLSVFLFDVHPTIFKAVTSWIGVCAVFYTILTFLPIIRKDSPYSAPLSLPFFFGTRYLFFRLLQWFPCIGSCLPLGPRAVHLDDYSGSMSKTAEQYALDRNPDIVHHSLLWTLQSLNKDSDLEKFFEGLPRLCGSETGKSLNLQEEFIVPNIRTLSNALIELMNRTLSCNLVPESIKQRRLIICIKAIESTSLFGPWWILRRVLLGGWHRFLQCIEFGLVAQNWKDITHPVTLFYRQCVAAITISIVQDHDERWHQLASNLPDVSSTLLHKYIGNGDSILLANAIFIARRTVQTYPGPVEGHDRNDIISASSKTLEIVCQLDIQHTLPELQHEFCGLWNQLVAVAQAQSVHPPHHSAFLATTTLKNIRKLYIALHKCSGTTPTAFYTTTDDQDPFWDNPKSYPVCTIEDHLPSEPIPGLQFDEPPPGSGDDHLAPNMNMSHMYSPTYPCYPPTRRPHFPTPSPLSSSNPYHTSPAPTHCGSQFANPYTHSGVPPPGADVPFPQPQLPCFHAPNVQPGAIAQLPPHRISTSLVSSAYLDCASTSDPSAGHGQSSRVP